MSFGEDQGAGQQGIGAPVPPSGGLRRYVSTARTNLLFRSARMALPIEAAAAAILTLGLWGHVGSPRAVIWLSAVWVLAALRGAIVRRGLRADQRPDGLLKWGRVFAAAAAAAGALWASALFLLWPEGAVGQQIFLAAGVTGTAGIVVFSIVGYPIAAYAYAASVAFAALGALFWRDAGTPFAGAGAVLIGAGAYGLAIRHFGALAVEQIKLRYDVTQASDAAQAANRAKAAFIANMSHELRTPLNAIIGFSELMQSEAFGPLGDKKYLEYAGDIQDSGSHLLDIINDILDLSKFEVGKSDLQLEPLDSARMVEAVSHLLIESAEKAGVTLRTAVPENAPLIHGDERAVKQILINLVSNAIKFTPPNGEVVVEAEAGPGGTIRLIVRDNGIGMAPEDVPTALTPFGQVGDARKFEGTGLGLPIVKSLVEQHGGEFRLTSELGEGTTATAIFPSATADSRPEKIAVAELA